MSMFATAFVDLGGYRMITSFERALRDRVCPALRETLRSRTCSSFAVCSLARRTRFSVEFIIFVTMFCRVMKFFENR